MACCEWRKKPENKKTWPNLKLHFAKAQKDLRLAQTATKNAGYQTVNAVNKPPFFL